MKKNRSAFKSTRAENEEPEDPQTDSYKISELVEIPAGNVEQVMAGVLPIAAPVSGSDPTLGLQTWKIKYSTILETAGGSVQSTFWESSSVPADTNVISGLDDDGNELTLLDLTSVYINGVLLSTSSFTLNGGNQTITLEDVIVELGDVVTVISLRSSQVPYEDNPVIFTSDVQTNPTAPQNFSITREAITNQQEANWFLLDKIDSIEIPETPEMDHLATQEWVLDQSYITDQVVTDAIDAQAQVQAEIDRVQDEAIQQNADKVAALEGSTTDARYKCSARPDPSFGEFVLTNILNEKVIEWEQCKYIKMTQTDFENNTHDFSRIYPGDFIRLAVSLTNNATYQVKQVMQGSQSVTLDVDFETRGGEASAYEGGIYDFTHFKSLNVNDFATINYVDQRDSATLSSANADAANKYVPKTGGSFTGEVTGKTPSQSSSKAFATVEYVDNALGSVTTDVPSANTTTKGIDYRGQCGTHSGSNPTLKKGQLSFDASSGKLYIGTG